MLIIIIIYGFKKEENTSILILMHWQNVKYRTMLTVSKVLSVICHTKKWEVMF